MVLTQKLYFLKNFVGLNQNQNKEKSIVLRIVTHSKRILIILSVLQQVNKSNEKKKKKVDKQIFL